MLIGSVRDKARIEHVFSVCKPDVVFHAAAHKHVPLMELSPGEAVKNNVFGTLNVAQACDQFGVSRMVLISTDKAVTRPISWVPQPTASWSFNITAATEKPNMLRFGLAMFWGSNGSVIPPL